MVPARCEGAGGGWRQWGGWRKPWMSCAAAVHPQPLTALPCPVLNPTPSLPSTAQLKAGDLEHVTQKLAVVKKHAEQLLDSVLNSPDVTPSAIVGMSDDEKAALRRRLDVADKALDRIKVGGWVGMGVSRVCLRAWLEPRACCSTALCCPLRVLTSAFALPACLQKHHAGGEPMTFDDYTALLHALSDQPTVSADLQAVSALPKYGLTRPQACALLTSAAQLRPILQPSTARS